MRSISSSMTIADQIEKEIWLKRMQAKENLNKVMQTFNAIMEKLDLMQKPIVPNIDHSQQNNLANLENSEDNMKEDCFVKQEDEKSNVEKQRMREGKCKRYDEHWDPKHRCANGKEKNLYNCEATNDSNNDDSDVEGIEDTPKFSPEVDDESIPQVSLSAMYHNLRH